MLMLVFHLLMNIFDCNSCCFPLMFSALQVYEKAQTISMFSPSTPPLIQSQWATGNFRLSICPTPPYRWLWRVWFPQRFIKHICCVFSWNSLMSQTLLLLIPVFLTAFSAKRCVQSAVCISSKSSDCEDEHRHGSNATVLCYYVA